MDWDNNTKIIVYCENPKGHTCYGGTRVFPFEYPNSIIIVKIVAINDKWIIVKTIKDQEKNFYYFLVDKELKTGIARTLNDSIIKSNIFGPLDSIDVIKEIKIKNIKINNLKW